MRKSKKYTYGLSKNFIGLKHNSTITLDTIEDLIREVLKNQNCSNPQLPCTT